MCEISAYSEAITNGSSKEQMEIAAVFQLLVLKQLLHKKKDQIRVHKICRKSHQVNQDIRDSPIIYVDLTWTFRRNSRAQYNWDNLDKPLQSYCAATLRLEWEKPFSTPETQQRNNCHV